jgi:hypothetical protein
VVSLAEATEATLQAMADGGLLEPADSAPIALLRSLSADIDALPPESRTKPLMVRQYQLALAALRGGRRDTDGTEALLQRIASTGSATMGHRAD